MAPARSGGLTHHRHTPGGPGLPHLAAAARGAFLPKLMLSLLSVNKMKEDKHCLNRQKRSFPFQVGPHSLFGTL